MGGWGVDGGGVVVGGRAGFGVGGWEGGVVVGCGWVGVGGVLGVCRFGGILGNWGVWGASSEGGGDGGWGGGGRSPTLIPR